MELENLDVLCIHIRKIERKRCSDELYFLIGLDVYNLKNKGENILLESKPEVYRP